MTESLVQPLNCTVRLSTALDRHLGITLDYLQRQGFDIPREIELLLEVFFLPLALSHDLDSSDALNAAHDSLAQLKLFRSTIQDAYHLDHSF
jgi:hypothetical protein